MPLCHYLWYEDWKCAECCQGDRCNYYVTVSILSFGKITLFASRLSSVLLLTQKLSLITVGSFQPNTQQIPCLGLNDSIISSNSNITVNKLLYSMISYLLVSYNVRSLLMYLFYIEYLGIIICTNMR